MHPVVALLPAAELFVAPRFGVHQVPSMRDREAERVAKTSREPARECPDPGRPARGRSSP